MNSAVSTRNSPCTRPEAASNDLPIISPVTPSKQTAKSTSPKSVMTLPTKDSNWKQREFSPDIEDESTWDVAYTDGACKGNGQPGATAGIGVWWGGDDSRCVLYPVCILHLNQVRFVETWQKDVQAPRQTIGQNSLYVSSINVQVADMTQNIGYCPDLRDSTPLQATVANQD